jgi:hypothetical protein
MTAPAGLGASSLGFGNGGTGGGGGAGAPAGPPGGKGQTLAAM